MSLQQSCFNFTLQWLKCWWARSLILWHILSQLTYTITLKQNEKHIFVTVKKFNIVTSFLMKLSESKNTVDCYINTYLKAYRLIAFFRCANDITQKNLNDLFCWILDSLKCACDYKNVNNVNKTSARCMQIVQKRIPVLIFQDNSSAHRIKQKFQDLYSLNMTIFLQCKCYKIAGLWRHRHLIS